MTPFSEAHTQLKPSLWARVSARRVLLVFALCLLAGLTAVAWRAKERLESTRAIARTEARACGAVLELQFSQVPGATDALGILARLGGGGGTNSMRVQEVLRRAQLDELPRLGYDFALFMPPSAQQKPVTIASRGLSSLQDTVQQPVRVKNFDLRLALKPRGGWINKSKLGFESLAVFLVSVLVSLLVNLLESRRAMEAELKDTAQRLAREVADRTQVQADCSQEKEKAAGARAEIRQVQAALQHAESKATQFQAQLDANVRQRDETARIHQAELKKTHAALQESQESVAQLRALLHAAVEAEKEASSAARQRLQRDQAAMAELQARLDAVTTSSRDAAETGAGRIAQLERGNRELQEQLIMARRDTSAESLDEVRSAPTPPAGESAAAETESDSSGAGPNEDARPDSSEVSLSGSARSPAIDDANSGPTLESVAPLPEPPPTPRPTKVPRRKQTRRDDQLALFGSEAVTDSLATQPVAEAEAQPVPNPETAEALEQPASSAFWENDPVTEGLPAGESPANAAEDPEHHLRALRRFTEEYALAPEQIRDALQQADLTVAQQLVHALQIAAQEIGATPVQKAVTALARACNEHSDPGTIELVWGELDKEVRELVATLKPFVLPKEAKPAPSRRLPAAPSVDPVQLRKAVSLILPLLAERDPGAKDCLKDNRNTFRSAFTPEAYLEFEQLVKSGNFDPALEQLRKAVKKHGISH